MEINPYESPTLDANVVEQRPYEGTGRITICAALLLTLIAITLPVQILVLAQRFSHPDAIPFLPFGRNHSSDLMVLSSAVLAALIGCGMVQVIRRRSYAFCRIAFLIASCFAFSSLACYVLPLGIWGLYAIHLPATRTRFGISCEVVNRTNCPASLRWAGVLLSAAGGSAAAYAALFFVQRFLNAGSAFPELSDSGGEQFASNSDLSLFWLVQLAAGVFVMLGAFAMLEMRSARQATFAALAACVPMLSPFGVMGIPLGIWATIILRRSDVAAQIAENDRLIAAAESTDDASADRTQDL